MSPQSLGAWQRAATTSVIWQAIAPARRMWTAAETATSRILTPSDRAQRLASPVSPESAENIDARAARILRSSALGRAFDRMRAGAAWRDSVTGGVCRQLVGQVEELSAVERVRLAGGVAAIASATALVLLRLSPRPEPLTWIVPALFLVVGVSLFAAARDRSSR